MPCRGEPRNLPNSPRICQILPRKTVGPSDQLHLVARATTVGSIMYASSAWWGFASLGDRQRFERLLARLRRCGFLPCDFPSIETLANEADRKLLKSISQCP